MSQVQYHLLEEQSGLPRREGKTRGQRRTFVAFLTCVGFIALSFLVSIPSVAPDAIRQSLWSQKSSTMSRFWSVKDSNVAYQSLKTFKKPANVPIVAVVFYGRTETVSILDCYLQRNLAKNGGMLDEVVFVARTMNQSDLAYLDTLVQDVPEYHKFSDDKYNGNFGFQSAYDFVHQWTDEETIYIKIDDDIIFIEDSAIPSLVETTISHPEYFIVSANVVNMPTTSWIHKSIGAIDPFLPDFGHAGSSFLGNITPPAGGHSWIPAPQGFPVDQTPISQSDAFDGHTKAWYLWTVGAQQHYNFLDKLAKQTLDKLRFPLWDFYYAYLGINFVAMRRKDLVAHLPVPTWNDEVYFGVEVPHKTGRHAVVDGRGLVSHYSFFVQKWAMQQTDVLAQYRDFAEKNICLPKKQTTPFP